MNIKTAKQVFDARDGIIKSKEIIENKIYGKFQKILINEGYVEKIKFGYYQWQYERAFSEAAIIARFFSDAVISLSHIKIYLDLRYWSIENLEYILKHHGEWMMKLIKD